MTVWITVWIRDIGETLRKLRLGSRREKGRKGGERDITSDPTVA